MTCPSCADRVAEKYASKADAERTEFQLRTLADQFRVELRTQLEHDRMNNKRQSVIFVFFVLGQSS